MGSVIREDTEGEPSAALTETGKGGLLSQGYLRDAPAREYVGDGETAVFVLTDESGVVRRRDGETTAIEPGKGYRAITVVTDRRLVVLVGDADGDGDRRITLPLVEIETVDHGDGTLEVTTTSGSTWSLPGDDAGLDDVAEYVTAAARTWTDVEATLDDVTRAIVTATDHREAGDYDAALSTMREARDDLEAITAAVERFGEEWENDALTARVDAVRDRCLRTAAAIRVGHARATVDEAETHWREGEYDRAREAFETALEAFRSVESLAPRHRTEVDDVEAAIERVERTIERLDETALREAAEAEERTAAAEGVAAIEALAEARRHYATAMAEESDDEALAGDADHLADRHDDVTDRLVATAESVGTDALEAGEWYLGTDDHDLAREELERAVAALEPGLAAAEADRPAAADDLREALEDARDALDELDEESEGTASATAPEGAETPGDGVTDGGAVDGDATREPADTTVDEVAETDGQTGNAAADGGVTTAAGSPTDAVAALDLPDGEAVDGDLAAELRSLAPAEFDRLVETVLEAMGWRPEATASSACDYLATGADDETLAVSTYPATDGEALDAETVRERAKLARSVPRVDGVAVATTQWLSQEARAAAEGRQVAVLDTAALSDALGGGAPASTSFDPAVDG